MLEDVTIANLVRTEINTGERKMSDECILLVDYNLY